MRETLSPGEIGEQSTDQSKDLAPNSLEMAFAQLKSDYGSAEFMDHETVEKINATHTELEKLMATEGISWDDHLESNQRSAIKNKVTGSFASDDPHEIARDIIKYLKQRY
jgi:hypothetical protein